MNSKSNSIVFLSVLLAASCYPEGPNCHHGIVIDNASSDSVVFALRFSDLTNCGLDGEILPPKSKVEWGGFRTCWENMLINGKSDEVYFVDPKQFYKGPPGLYDCDSIDIKNKILKHYVFTLDDLQKNNFTITYE